MKSEKRKLRIRKIDKNGNIDLRSGDGEDIDEILGKRIEGGRREKRMDENEDEDKGDFRKEGLGMDIVKDDLDIGIVKKIKRIVDVEGGNGKGNVGIGEVLRKVMKDNVEIDVILGKRKENWRRKERKVGKEKKRNMWIIIRKGDKCEEMMLKDLLIVENKS